MFQLLYRYYSDMNHIIYHAVMLLGIIIGILRFKKINNSSKFFLLLLLITLLTEITAYYFAVKYSDNRFIYNLFNLVQFLLICAAFYIDYNSKKIVALFLLFIAFICFNSIFYQPFLSSSNSNGFLVEQLFIMVLFFNYLVTYFKNTEQDSLQQYPLFWIGLGLLIFSVTSIIAFGFDYITEEGSFWDKISVWVKRISNYLLYLSFTIAFLSPQKSLHDLTPDK